MERLATHIEASGLLRSVDQAGGFGTVLRKGDADRGALLLVIASRGQHHACLERTLSPDGNYRWLEVGPKRGAAPETIADWSRKRVSFDSDLWLIELDVADAERFIAETTAFG